MTVMENLLPTHSQNGDSALAWAADHGHVDCVQTLVSRMAPLDSKNKVRVVSIRSRGNVLSVFDFLRAVCASQCAFIFIGLAAFQCFQVCSHFVFANCPWWLLL